MGQPPENGWEWVARWLSAHSTNVWPASAAAITHFLLRLSKRDGTLGQILRDVVLIAFITFCLVPAISPILESYGAGPNSAPAIGSCVGLVGPGRMRQLIVNGLVSWLESPFEPLKNAATAVYNWVKKRGEKGKDHD